MTGKILLVDDSGLARRSTRAMLEGAGYEVVEAEDGMAALERYFVEKPDVVLLDLVMKGMYGLDVLAKLRELDPRRARDRASRPTSRPRRARWSARPARRDSSTSRSTAEDLLNAVSAALRRAGVMELTAVQQDALVELLNIGFGRAAASLSQLTGHRVRARSAAGLDPSDRRAVGSRSSEVITGDVASVHQIFSGPVAGDALLILDHAAARRC